MRQFAGEYAFHAVLLAAALLPAFPGVFLRGDVAFPGNFIYDSPPWANYQPPDLTPQTPYLETPMQANVWYTLTKRSMEAGNWPLWNPYQCAGLPLLGVFQTAIFYPPRLVFLALTDTYVAFTAFMLLKLWLCGMSAYVCARALGVSRGFSSFFSFAYMLGGYVFTWCCYPTTDSMAWLPILFLGLESLIAGRYVRGFALAYLGEALMLLGAGAQHTLTSGILAGIYFLARLTGRGSFRSAAASAGTGLLAAIAALGTCAVQIVPFVEYLRLSDSTLERIFETTPLQYYYELTDLLAFWTPRYFGAFVSGNYHGNLVPFYLSMLYLGVPVWIGVALTFCTRGAHPLDAARRWLCALSGVSLLLIIRPASLSFVYEAPLLNSIRPVYYFAFAAFALPLAAAMSLDRWFQGTPSPRRLWPALALGFVVMAATGVHFYFDTEHLRYLDGVMAREGTLFSQVSLEKLNSLPIRHEPGTLAGYVLRQILWTAAMFLLGVACLATACFRQRAAKAGGILMTLLLVLDLSAANWGIQPTSRRKDVFPDVPLTQYLQTKGHPYRISFTDLRVAGYPAVYGLEEVDGYDAYIPRRFYVEPMFSRKAWDALRPAFAIPCRLYIDSPDARDTLPRGFEIEKVIDGVIVAADTRALPRARLVPVVRTFASTDAMIAHVEANGVDPSREVLVDIPIDVQTPEHGDTPPGLAAITVWDWNRVVVETDAANPAVLVLAEAYYPGWEAIIDGEKSAEVFPAYHLLRGVAVPQGRHTVEFVFRPRSFTLGAVVSLISLAALILAAVTIIARRTRVRSAP